MKDPARLMSRSGLAAAPMVPGRSSALERQKSAPLRPGTWLLLALLLAVTAPAYGFDDKEPSSQAVDDLVLHGLDVPAAANWVVLDATGIAAWRAEGDTRWQRFSRGEVLPPGCEIETGSDGEVTLVAGGDQLTIASQGRLILPIAQPGQDRRLRHERGRILVQIESREARDVRVDTPLLSLGIKGTTFEVAVEPSRTACWCSTARWRSRRPAGAMPWISGPAKGCGSRPVPGSAPTPFILPATEPGDGRRRADLALGLCRNEGRRPAGCASRPGQRRSQPSRAAGEQESRGRRRSGAAGGLRRRDRLRAAGSSSASSWGSCDRGGRACDPDDAGLVLGQNLREQWRAGRAKGNGGAAGSRLSAMLPYRPFCWSRLIARSIWSAGSRSSSAACWMRARFLVARRLGRAVVVAIDPASLQALATCRGRGRVATMPRC